MKIVLSGVETYNKGAELMLYAILQEIERRYPDAQVYIPYGQVKQGLNYVNTKLCFRYTPCSRFINQIRLGGILRRLHLPKEWQFLLTIVNHADYFIDASGFHFSDQKKNFTPAKVAKWNFLLKKYSKQGTKIVFLPQAFGPALKENTLNGLMCISKYADLIMPRERISYDYLGKSGVMDMTKVVLYTDFTSLVEGTVPKGYERLRGAICIIPNMRMIDTGTCSLDNYIRLMSAVVKTAVKSGRLVYFLNHEGKHDEELAYKCSEVIDSSIEVVSGLNALEVKGLIASAYLVVSSRFHGVASSLNSCVPCLATSWSHKYQELFIDYGMENCLLPLDDTEKVEEKVWNFIEERRNLEIRKQLSIKVPKIKNETKEMWRKVWEIN